MSSLVARMDNLFYPEFGDNWDDDIFRERILSCLKADHSILDLGAGAGIVPQMNFIDSVERICGIDVDPRVTANPFLHEGLVADATAIPYEDETFDVIFSDNVMEHIEDPESVFKEVARTLKPGGIFLFKTPNKWHYMPLIARMTPHWFHRAYNKFRGRASEDTFPTLYRANMRRDIEAHAGISRLNLSRIELIEGRPEYMRVSALTYPFGVVYERFVNRFSALSRFRILLIATLEKPSGEIQEC